MERILRHEILQTHPPAMDVNTLAAPLGAAQLCVDAVIEFLFQFNSLKNSLLFLGSLHVRLEINRSMMMAVFNDLKLLA